MTNPPTRRFVLQSTLLVTAAWAGQRAKACEYFGPTLRVTHPWTRATPAGSEFAVLGMRFDEVMEDEHLLEVHTPVAEAVVFVPEGYNRQTGQAGQAAPGQPLPLYIPAGRETVLGQITPGGHHAQRETGPHLRLLRLTQDLEVGRSYPLRLVFKVGGSVKAQLNVDYARFT